MLNGSQKILPNCWVFDDRKERSCFTASTNSSWHFQKRSCFFQLKTKKSEGAAIIACAAVVKWHCSRNCAISSKICTEPKSVPRVPLQFTSACNYSAMAEWLAPSHLCFPAFVHRLHCHSMTIGTTANHKAEARLVCRTVCWEKTFKLGTIERHCLYGAASVHGTFIAFIDS